MFSRLIPRKKIFVSGRIQGQLVLRLGLYWVLYHFVLWHALFAYHFVEQRMSGTITAVPFGELYASFWTRYYPIVMCAVCMLPIFLVDLVRLSHRIAGPLVRFRNSLQQMIAGEEVRHVRLRKGDLLTELETTFNTYVDVYEGHRRERVAAAKMSDRDAQRIEAIVEGAEHGADAASDPLAAAHS
jgi:sensor histidine kinase YesM